MGLSLSVACQSPPPPQLTSFEIRGVPPSLTSGSGRAGLDADGDLVIEVSVRGPAAEISREGRAGSIEPNLIWHLVTGDCATWERPNAPGRNVLYRWSPSPDHADSVTFRSVIKRELLDNADQPDAVAAFRNGRDPFVACGDLPRFRR